MLKHFAKLNVYWSVGFYNGNVILSLDAGSEGGKGHANIGHTMQKTKTNLKYNDHTAGP